VAVDASGTFSEHQGTKSGSCANAAGRRHVSDYATLIVEILKDNARPEAGEVYGAMHMPWATLVGQIAYTHGK
jgi:hypothetical protein